MSKSSLLLVLGLLATASAFAATPEATFLAEHGLSGKSVEQIVETIDQSPQNRPLPYSASITSTELKLSSGDQIYTLPLGDKFYLSFALMNGKHILASTLSPGCQGEMPEKAFNVKVTDNKGEVVVQKSDEEWSKWLRRGMATAQYRHNRGKLQR